MQAQHVLPPGMPPSAHAEPPRAAGYELEPPPPPPRKLQCPAPGCGKSYACSSSLYVHKRNKHPELIRPRGNQAVRVEVAGVQLVGAELTEGAQVSQMAGVQIASISAEIAEIAGAEMASAEVLAGEVLGGEVLGAGAGSVTCM